MILVKKKMNKESFETDIEKLELEGYRIIDIIAGDIKPTKEMQYIIDKITEEKRESFYSDILYNLTSERFNEDEAKKFWRDILQHKYIISEKLDRNVGIRVAALDYLENIKMIIELPKIIEESEFKKTMAFATSDSLTGLFNRRKFVEELLRRIGNYRPDKNKFTMLMLDLDGFKKLNDTQGHSAGDLVLQEFAYILKTGLPEDAIIGRYGGDEIVILIDNVDKITAVGISENVRKKVEEEFKELNITVSIGIAEFPVDGKNFNEIMAHVDEILYRAKEFGGNRVAHFIPVEISYQSSQNITDVSCVGDFNRWNKNYGIMSYYPETSKWSVKMNLKPGTYRYKFLIDGKKWIPDPKAKKFVDDGFGGQCSVLTVE